MATAALVPDAAPVTSPRASERSETVGAACKPETSGSAVLTNDPEPRLEEFENSGTPWEDYSKAIAHWVVRQHQGKPSLALAPKPAAPHMTLYELEDQLCALIDTAEMVTPEEQEAFFLQVQETLNAAVEKRDRVGQFLTHLEAQAALADAEIRRLQERKARYQKMFEHMEQYVIRVIQGLGQDAKGKWQKLEGKTITLSIAKCPDSVEIVEDGLIPPEYKTITVTLPLPQWQELLDSLDLEQAGKIEDAVKTAKYAVSKTQIKAALPVAGAKLVNDKYRLVRK